MGRAGRDLRRPRSAKETDDARKIERYRQLARIALHAAAQARRGAQAGSRRSCSARPTTPRRCSNLEQIFTQAGSYKELLAIYRQARGARDRAAAAPRDALQDRLDRGGAARRSARRRSATYREILETDEAPATQTRALRALEKLNAARGDAGGMADVLERQLVLADKGDEDTRLELSQRLGEIYELNLSQPRPRRSAHYRAAFALSPSHKPTVAALERWLEPRGARPTIASRWRASCVPVYEQRLAMTRGAAQARRRARDRARRGEGSGGGAGAAAAPHGSVGDAARRRDARLRLRRRASSSARPATPRTGA